MKKAAKFALSLVLAVITLLGIPSTVLAADASINFLGEKGFEFQPGSKYTATDLFDNFKNVLPGDTVRQTITFTNSARDCDVANLYMRAVTHNEETNPLSEKAAETETVATMSEFLSKLSMKVWNGGELIYEASPDQLDGLKNNVYLGSFRTGEKTTLTVELTVPADLGNEYMNRVGEVDWIFHAETYNESQISVRKVWADGNQNHLNDSVTVNLLRGGRPVRTRVLNAANGWACTFEYLREGYEWTVEEADVPAGYTASYRTVGNTTVITNTPVSQPGEQTEVSVEKVWVNNGHTQPRSVTVQLCKNGEPYDTVTLSKENQWQYAWAGLSKDSSWSVQEVNVPKGYRPAYAVNGTHTTITNTYGTAVPGVSGLTVHKVWKDNGSNRPNSVTVELLQDGKTYAAETLSEANNWSYTWDQLDDSHSWAIVETDLPEGYAVRYDVDGSNVTITNIRQGAPVTLTVRKVWSNDKVKSRPASATVVLYDGEKAVETVRLDASNNWSCTWTDLAASGNWQITEINIPKGYTPSYQVKDGVVTVTNTATLIQTGQLNWPIAVLGGLGLVMISLGGIMIFRKKKNRRV